MNEAILEAEGTRNTFGAKVGLAGLDSYIPMPPGGTVPRA